MNQGAAAQGPVLRDIHLPPTPPWWPPAPGWWLLAVLLLVGLLVGVVGLLRVLRARRWRRRLRAQLDRIAAAYRDHGSAARLCAELSGLLRRASLLIDARASTLTGDAWLDFLDAQGVGKGFRSGPGSVLIDAPWRRQVEIDSDALLNLVRAWFAHAFRDGNPATRPLRRWQHSQSREQTDAAHV